MERSCEREHGARRPRRRVTAVALFAVASLGVRTALAQGDAHPPPSGPASAPDGGALDAARTEAKRLFEQGNALRKAGDCERAAVLFQRSRALHANVPNTLNAGVCLTAVGRIDEALELLEKLVTELAADLRSDERAWLGTEVARLRAMVGTIDVVGEPGAELVIDGRARGRLPLTLPLHALPGKRAIAVSKSGFAPFSAEVSVEAGATRLVRATLEPLTFAGRVRIEAEKLEGMLVRIDGAPVGTMPWEGVLAPGEHYFQVEREDAGSAPASFVVVTGQTTRVTPDVQPIGPEVRVTATPSSAEIVLGGVRLGAGRWLGRLPQGDHELLVREEGYMTARRRVAVTTEGRAIRIDVTLRPDEAHPRWGASSSTRGHFWIEAVGAAAVAPSLGSGAEDSCARYACEGAGPGIGAFLGGRAGYELPVGVSPEVMGGYLAVVRTQPRRVDASFQSRDGALVRTAYDLEDELRVSGAVIAAGAGLRRRLVGPLEVSAHAALGAFFASAADRVTARASAGASSADVDVAGSGTSSTAVDLLLAPELRLGVGMGAWSVTAGLTLFMMLLDGPAGALGDATVRRPCDADQAPREIGCAPGESFAANERPYGPFVLPLPGVSLRYTF